MSYAKDLNLNRKRPGEMGSPIQKKKQFVVDRESDSDSDDNPGPSFTPAYSFYSKSQENDNEADSVHYSSFAKKQMELMGHKEGEGLGKFNQGRAEIVSTEMKRGRRGLGFQVEGFDDVNTPWVEEEVKIIEDRDSIPLCNLPVPSTQDLQGWCKVGPRKLTIDDETDFCDSDILSDVLSSKSVFDALTGMEFLRARTRANPYEFIKGAIFQNRAAVKMANIDSAFDFMFTSPKTRDGSDVVRANQLLYFADICAGPGGFSEYVLWRKSWKSKGFGFTLKGDCDFKLDSFLAGTPETFEPHYGVNAKDGDGDIFKQDNIEAFKNFVMDSTDGQGCHFVMADGGFSVEGQENIQEILSKQLYLCQFVCALSILRPGGHFVCKLFDLFTHFSLGLVYLMYRAFDEVFIFKPVTSRPANSERYIVCKFLRENTSDIRDHMFNVNVRINRLKGTERDVMQVVPLDIIKSDHAFFSYMKASNEKIAKAQINSLRKLRAYVQDPAIMGPYDQVEVRKKCLQQWQIPLQARANARVEDADVKFQELWKGNTDDNFFSCEPTKLINENLHNLKCVFDYKCEVSGGERYFILGIGGSLVYKWNGRPVYSGSKWSKLEGCALVLPKDTLLDAEIVEELQGEGKGQKRSKAIHIIDAIMLGGLDVRDKHHSERIAMASLFAKALNKPTRQDLTPIRAKQMFRLDRIKDIFQRLETRSVKGRRGQRECFSINDERHFVPRAIYFMKHIQEPWTHCFSKSQKKLYFFNKQKKFSTFECPKDSVASFKTSFMGRYLWPWEDFEVELKHGTRLERNRLLDFIHSTHCQALGQ